MQCIHRSRPAGAASMDALSAIAAAFGLPWRSEAVGAHARHRRRLRSDCFRIVEYTGDGSVSRKGATMATPQGRAGRFLVRIFIDRWDAPPKEGA